MANYNRNGKGRKRNYAKANTRSSKAKVSKPLRKAIISVMKTKVESKTINCPLTPGGSANSVFTPYPALSGVQYLVQDIFKVTQGVEDSTSLNAPNRIGDRIQAIGFLMDYYFSIPNYYSIASTSFFIPYVKLRITVFKQAFGSPLLSTPLLYDSNFLATATSTLQPINWDEGYVKDVLYDKVVIIRNNLGVQAAGSGTLPGIPPSGNMFHFHKYIKYPHTVKFTDNNSASPNSTDKPIYVAISAEVDDSNTGLVPSGTKILWSTGYTRGWFKDA